MNRKFFLLAISLIMYSLVPAQKPANGLNAESGVFIDKDGVIRWKKSRKEVALFGANYSLPSACDYRAAGYVKAERKKIVDHDMVHFARMGWDGMRLCFWGDFENSDKDGNLISNNHLDILDYAIFKASERGIYILFSPITTYSSQWPDAMQDTLSARGFSVHYEKSKLGIDPDAIRAQQNYLRQILNHVNPYTGNAIKDEPNILFIEMINEPWHHSNDFKASVNYINALVKAVRSTGCKKLLFHNISQDMKMEKAILASDIDGATFAWYPTGLNSGHMLTGNNLRSVDQYKTLIKPALPGIPRLVYEFDEPDSYTPYMYPAMVRAFRGAGAQFAAMFSYDMIETAPYNLGWQTHLLNMVYYPKKAAGAIIAAEVMRQIPLYSDYGPYPRNTSFGPFLISYDEDLSEMVTPEKYMYSGNTRTMPPSLQSLKQIVGYGSSPLINYQGRGIYFLDKVSDGLWRLEVYPDALLTSDPFDQMSPDKVVSRLISREWKMKVGLPDLGNSFYVLPVNENNSYKTRALNGAFDIQPGVYLLSVAQSPDKDQLPEKIGNLKFDEYICPQPMELPRSVIPQAFEEYISGEDIVVRAEVIDTVTPDDVSLFYRLARYPKWFIKVPMVHVRDYLYEATIPAGKVSESFYNYCITVTRNNQAVTYPATVEKSPWDWDFYSTDQWSFQVVNKTASLKIFNPETDYPFLAFTRIGDGGRTGVFDLISGSDNGNTAIRKYLPLQYDSTLKDYTMSLNIMDKIKARGKSISELKGICIRARKSADALTSVITFMESDGTCWSCPFEAKDQWSDIYIDISRLKISQGVLLPLSFPEQWNYWVAPAEGRGIDGDKINLENVEKLQISLRPSNSIIPEKNPWIEISSVNLVY